MQQSVEIFDHLPDGRAVERVTLRAGALSVKLLCWGAILQDLRFGNLDYSLTQGSSSFEPYLDTMRYHGPIIGPVVNRIAGAKAQIGDQTHLFGANQTPDICLHLGETGMQVYDARDTEKPHSALAFEAQSWPDAPNHKSFPSISYHAEEAYHQITEWQFLIENKR